MNAMGDHSMATRRAFIPFDDFRPELDEMVGGDWSGLDGFPAWARCRVLAMRPGGPVARLMAAHAVCMKVRAMVLCFTGGVLARSRAVAVPPACACFVFLVQAVGVWRSSFFYVLHSNAVALR